MIKEIETFIGVAFGKVDAVHCNILAMEPGYEFFVWEYRNSNIENLHRLRSSIIL